MSCEPQGCSSDIPEGTEGEIRFFRTNDPSGGVRYTLDQQSTYTAIVVQKTPTYYETELTPLIESTNRMEVRAGDLNAPRPPGGARRELMEVDLFYRDIRTSGFDLLSNAENFIYEGSGDPDNISGMSVFHGGYLPAVLPTLSSIAYQYGKPLFKQSFQRKQMPLFDFAFPPLRETYMRVYKHGWCSAYQPLTALYEPIATALSQQAYCATKASSADYIPNMQTLGFFPFFYRPEDPALDQGYLDGFGIYGGFKVDNLPLWFEHESGFHGEYILGAKDNQVTVDVFFCDAARPEFKSAVCTQIPTQLQAQINAQLLRPVPNFSTLKFGPVNCGPGVQVCGEPAPCDLANPDLDSCQQSAALTLSLAGNLVGGLDQGLAELSAKEFLASDFACQPRVGADGCELPGKGQCVLRLPVSSVNVYPDAFELVFREAADPLALDPVALLAAVSEEAAPFCSPDRVPPLNSNEAFMRPSLPISYAGQTGFDCSLPVGCSAKP